MHNFPVLSFLSFANSEKHLYCHILLVNFYYCTCFVAILLISFEVEVYEGVNV